MADLFADGPVTVSYTLTEADYFNCLQSGRVFRTTGLRAVIETAILAVIGGGYLCSYLFIQHERGSLLMACVCAAVIAVIWIVPNAAMHARAREQATNRPFAATIEPEQIRVAQGEQKWTIPLNGTFHCWETPALFVLENADRQMTALPKSAFSAAQQTELRALLQAHTIAGCPRRRR